MFNFEVSTLSVRPSPPYLPPQTSAGETVMTNFVSLKLQYVKRQPLSVHVMDVLFP